MGWAKYSEDNYDAFYERQALKGGENDFLTHYFATELQAKNNPEEEKQLCRIF